MWLQKSARRRRIRARRVRFHAGNAGVVATAAIAFAGLAIGASAAYLAGRGVAVEASYAHSKALDLRNAPLAGGSIGFESRDEMVDRVLSVGVPERFDTPPMVYGEPRIIIVFDDIGLSRSAYEEVMRLPGPVTLSFLPYADNAQPLIERALDRGDAVLLHLPMEPTGKADPGPRSLKATMSSKTLMAELEWNLSRFEGYSGVNNHMGSRFTRDNIAMKTVLSVLAERDLFFLDSLTTEKSLAAEAGEAVGARVYMRDVFLDAEAGQDSVRRQLALMEKIAIETGFAVAIAHPRRNTLDVIGPWLTSAPDRGFRLDTVEALPELQKLWDKRRQIAAR